MFDPFSGRSQEFFRGSDSRRLSNQQAAQYQAVADAVSNAASNKSFVVSARESYEARKREQQAAQEAANAAQEASNSSGLFGAGLGVFGSIASAVIM